MGAKKVIAFIPVLHEGYRLFIDKNVGEDDTLFICGRSLIGEFPHLLKEIRLLDPFLIEKALRAWRPAIHVEVLEKEVLKTLSQEDMQFVAPDEDIMREFFEKYFPEKKVQFESVFLRWDKHNSIAEKPVQPDQRISSEKFDKEMLSLASVEANKSSDWWRKIGAVIVKNGKVAVTTHNRHVPSEQLPYQNGDPRNNFHKGVHLELSTAIHAEAGAIAEAARQGLSLEGTSLYVSTFPCPPCAKLVAYSGIKKIYYHSGYGVLDGESILKSQEVEIIFVE